MIVYLCNTQSVRLMFISFRKKKNRFTFEYKNYQQSALCNTILLTVSHSPHTSSDIFYPSSSIPLLNGINAFAVYILVHWSAVLMMSRIALHVHHIVVNKQTQIIRGEHRKRLQFNIISLFCYVQSCCELIFFRYIIRISWKDSPETKNKRVPLS